MKSTFSLLAFVFLSIGLFAQTVTDEEYIQKWEEYKKDHAPFNVEEKVPYLFGELANQEKKMHLGNLKYRKERNSFGQDILEVAFWTATVVHELTRDHDSIHEDPASFFEVGYRKKNY